jgi:hypothetical protein
MGRRPFRLLSAASLLAFGVTAGLWAVSVLTPVDDVPLPGGWRASLRHHYLHATRHDWVTGVGLGLTPWVVVSAGTLLVVGGARLWVRRGEPATAGHCPACGYDLRATPDRCPECGSKRSETTA